MIGIDLSARGYGSLMISKFSFSSKNFAAFKTALCSISENYFVGCRVVFIFMPNVIENRAYSLGCTGVKRLLIYLD